MGFVVSLLRLRDFALVCMGWNTLFADAKISKMHASCGIAYFNVVSS
jgi:hypothetical protein